jgi:hypothetical protein
LYCKRKLQAIAPLQLSCAVVAQLLSPKLSIHRRPQLRPPFAEQGMNLDMATASKLPARHLKVSETPAALITI